MFLSDDEKCNLSNIHLRKIVPISVCKKFLETQLLFMDQVKSWDDHYENFFLKERIHASMYDINCESVIPYVYGQSWSYGDESYLMWRAYLKDSMAVCLETTADRLFDVCSLHKKDLCALWLGKVNYIPTNMIDEIVKQASMIPANECQSLWNKFFPKTLFYKRTEFKDETEFRVVRIIPSEGKCYSKIGAPKRICYNISPSAVFTAISINPFLPKSLACDEINSIRKLCNDSIPVTQSKLFSFCPIDIYLK